MQAAQALGRRDGDQKQHEADRKELHQAEPAALPDPHARGDAVRDRDRPGPVLRIHDVRAQLELRPEAVAGRAADRVSPLSVGAGMATSTNPPSTSPSDRSASATADSPPSRAGR